ncbi:MAG: cytoplasmic protein [Anaerolineales bacterium]|nr:MAG: cytoplasmic protein [Anaerolineales bacterium]
MSEKIALFAFNGDPLCFVHVLLNALDMESRGYDVRVIIEGSATKTVNLLNTDEAQFHKLYVQVREKGLIDCVCKACAAKMGALEGIQMQGLPLCSEMAGHPSMAKYIDEGYRIITF